MTVFAQTVAERTPPGQRQDVEEKQYTIHAYASSKGVCGIVISDPGYPSLVAHSLLSKIIDEFTSAHPESEYRGTSVGKLEYLQLKDYLVKYQTPQDVDSITKIQLELDDTKVCSYDYPTLRAQGTNLCLRVENPTQDDRERDGKLRSMNAEG